MRKNQEFKNILAARAGAIRRSAELIRAGELVAFPTETVYGLGANALDPRAVAKIFEAKRRPRFDPLIVHVASQGEALELWKGAPPLARQLMNRFWPGPLTLVLAKSEIVPDIVTAGLDTVAVRIPAHPVALALLRAARRPIAAPSANMFGRSSPTTAQAVAEDLGDRVAMILDGGRCPIGLESTVISLSARAVEILRIGATPLAELKEALGRRMTVKIVTKSRRPRSPGMLKHHYAPAKPLFLLVATGRRRPGTSFPFPHGKTRRPTSVHPLSRAALLAFASADEKGAFLAVEILSASGDLAEAAANYFAALRKLDGTKADFILAQEVPEEGLGLAIMDRLCRAAAGTAMINWVTRSAMLFARE